MWAVTRKWVVIDTFENVAILIGAICDTLCVTLFCAKNSQLPTEKSQFSVKYAMTNTFNKVSEEGQVVLWNYVAFTIHFNILHPSKWDLMWQKMRRSGFVFSSITTNRHDATSHCLSPILVTLPPMVFSPSEQNGIIIHLSKAGVFFKIYQNTNFVLPKKFLFVKKMCCIWKVSIVLLDDKIILIFAITKLAKFSILAWSSGGFVCWKTYRARKQLKLEEAVNRGKLFPYSWS